MLAIIVKGYPRLSETFIAREILMIQQKGIPFVIVSLRKSTDKTINPINLKITAPVLYLPEYLYQEPFRVLKGFLHARKQPNYREARALFLKDLCRDKTSNRLRRWGQAMVLAHEFSARKNLNDGSGEASQKIQWIYSHYLHTPSSVARYTARLLGLDWGASAHARDIWTSPEWELKEKLEDVKFCATCTQVNEAYLRGLVAPPHQEKIELVRHGIDLDDFTAPPDAPNVSEETSKSVRLVSVGRLVEKKGYDDLLNSLALLPKNLDWHLDHLGGGPLSDELKNQAAQLLLSDRITWHGAQSSKKVLAILRQADIFTLASKISPSDGDRDGLPNVMVEAQSQKLPIVATSTSAIPELIEHGVNGLLSPAGNIQVFSDNLLELSTNESKRKQMGEQGYAQIIAKFSQNQCILGLFDLFKRHFSDILTTRS